MNKIKPIADSLKRLQRRYPTDSVIKIISNARKTRPWLKGYLTDSQLLEMLKAYEQFK